MGNPYKKYVCKKFVEELRGPITWPKHAYAQVCFGQSKPNLKLTELQKSKNRGKKGRIRHKNKKTENHKKQRLATLKRLKRGDDNEFERNLRLQKVVPRKVLKLAVETEEDRRARLENDAATTPLRLAMWTDKESKARLEKMVATHMLAMIKGVVDVGVVLS